MTRDEVHRQTFDSLDKNGDAQISKTEASADSKLTDNFAADTNGDGYLSKANSSPRPRPDPPRVDR